MTKTDFDNSVLSLDSNIAANKTKNESIENELKNLKTLVLSYFIGKSLRKRWHTKLFSI